MRKERIVDFVRNIRIEAMGCPTCGGDNFQLVLTQHNREGDTIDEQTLTGDIARSVLDTIPHWSGKSRT